VHDDGLNLVISGVAEADTVGASVRGNTAEKSIPSTASGIFK
jgi:hypothetical protein